MKKLVTLLLLILSVAAFTGCSNQKNEISPVANSTNEVKHLQKASIVIKEDNKEIVAKTIEFNDKMTVMQALEKNFDIKENNGMITSIDGIDQDEAGNKYWLYEVNGEMAQKSANEQVLKENDIVTFNLAKI